MKPTSSVYALFELCVRLGELGYTRAESDRYAMNVMRGLDTEAELIDALVAAKNAAQRKDAKSA